MGRVQAAKLAIIDAAFEASLIQGRRAQAVGKAASA